MENLIFGIIIFIIIGVIQFFIKRASKSEGQSSNKSPFSGLFEQIKNEFKETVNEYTVKEKPKTVYNDYKTEKEEKEEITEVLIAPKFVNEVKENKEQLSSYSVESYLSPIEKINNLPAIQSAVIWKEILDQPKAFRIDDYPED